MNVEESERIEEWLRTLARSDERDELEQAAVHLAESGAPEAIEDLGVLLRDPRFLARLDDLSDPAAKTYHLARVLAALGRSPSLAAGVMEVELANDAGFLADDDRRIYLLPALAAVRPMSEEAAAVFGRAASEGYFSTAIPLLVSNASPRALVLFEELIRDATVDPEGRVADIHSAVLPCRTNADVLRSAERLLASGLEEPVANGLLETIFDYRSREWFGPARNPPAPLAWESGPTEALEIVLRLAEGARARDLPPALAEAVDRTASHVRSILEGREHDAARA